MSNRFSPLQNDDQNLTTKEPTSTIPNIPEKIPINSRNTSPICTTENYLKNFIPFTDPGNSDCAGIIGRKVLVVDESHVKRIRRNDFYKELKNGKAIF